MRALAIAVLVAVAPRAYAQPTTAPEPIDLRYGAAEGCPDAAAFFASVKARANAALAMHADRTFEVSIESGAEGFHGTLRVSEGAQVATRDVSGASCSEVADALALVAALAIEQRRAELPRPPAPIVVAGNRVTPEQWHMAAGAGMTLLAGIAPDPLWGGGLFATGGSGRSGVRLRAAIVRTLETDATMPAGATAFRTTAARGEVCPHVFVLGVLELAPCAGLAIGVLDARGTTVDMPASERRPWVAPDGLVRAGLRFGAVTVEIEGGIAVPLVRDRFVLAPSTTVHEVPSVTTAVGTSVAIQIF